MSDRELLEVAANAAGVPGYELYDTIGDNGGVEKYGWNPLTDDGDALRLAVRLDIHVRFYGATVVCETMDGKFLSGEVDAVGDRMAATRRAIVRAAAEIGKNI